MPEVEVIVAPFHAGARCCKVGNGPDRLLGAGLVKALRADGAYVTITEIAPVDDFEGEIGRTFEVKRRVALAVAAAVAKERFPLVLAGNCNTTVGVRAGISDHEAGIVWFDAHPDFNTPDEMRSGYFDGMGVATLAGQCWHQLAASIPGHRPIDLSTFVYCGIRDFEPGQREKVEASAIRAVYGGTGEPVNFVRDLAVHLTAFPGRTLVHLDLDCLDTAVGHANGYAAPGGLSGDQLLECLRVVAARSRPVAMTIASFDPSLLGSEAIAGIGVAAARAVAQAAASRQLE